jgi:hypothetical protein
VFGNGGILGKFGGSVMSEIGKPTNVTVSGGAGIGAGASGGVMVCEQKQICLRD